MQYITQKKYIPFPSHYLFNIDYTCFTKICNLVSQGYEKHYQFESQVTSTGHRLPFVLAAVDRAISNITACDKIHLMTVLHCDICLFFDVFIKSFSPLWKASCQQNRKQCVVVCTTRSDINQHPWFPDRNGFTASRSTGRNIGMDAFLWPPCVADADIIFLPCDFYLLFYSSPNLSGSRLDVYHTSPHDVALVRI